MESVKRASSLFSPFSNCHLHCELRRAPHPRSDNNPAIAQGVASGRLSPLFNRLLSRSMRFQVVGSTITTIFPRRGRAGLASSPITRLRSSQEMQLSVDDATGQGTQEESYYPFTIARGMLISHPSSASKQILSIPFLTMTDWTTGAAVVVCKTGWRAATSFPPFSTPSTFASSGTQDCTT